MGVCSDCVMEEVMMCWTRLGGERDVEMMLKLVGSEGDLTRLWVNECKLMCVMIVGLLGYEC